MTVEFPRRELFGGEQDPRPVVALPRPFLPGLAIAAIGFVLALLLLWALARSTAPEGAKVPEVAPSSAFAPPPPLEVARRTAPVMVAPAVAAPPPVRTAPALATPAPAPRLSAPSVSVEPVPTRIAPPPEPYYRPLPPQASAEGGEQRTARAAPALVFDAASSGLKVGTLIPAVLETPIDTSRPGFARAMVSGDVRGEGSRRILIPRGSRLIGEYQGDVRSGQNRVLVNWTQLIRPDGLTLRLGAPAADDLGGSGIPGKVNGFFLARFLDAALQTALSLGSNVVAGGGSTVIVGLPGAANAAIGQGMNGASANRRKITVRQGTTFNVFVAREVDFSGSAEPSSAAGNASQRPTPQR